MYVSMYVYMSMYVCMYVCMYIRVCMYVCIYVYVCMYVSLHLSMDGSRRNTICCHWEGVCAVLCTMHKPHMYVCSEFLLICHKLISNSTMD